MFASEGRHLIAFSPAIRWLCSLDWTRSFTRCTRTSFLLSTWLPTWLFGWLQHLPDDLDYQLDSLQRRASPGSSTTIKVVVFAPASDDDDDGDDRLVFFASRCSPGWKRRGEPGETDQRQVCSQKDVIFAPDSSASVENFLSLSLFQSDDRHTDDN